MPVVMLSGGNTDEVCHRVWDLWVWVPKPPNSKNIDEKNKKELKLTKKKKKTEEERKQN